ncbi:hypothetical protein AMJ87_00335 [candidate division WOR_3 bacterium SM23_60]|uniref:Uncharacterized protein n=1 Tax=candidate division WOR_3 bacterium SM23_60 TaxID=1703780 RepID=A0A0S8GLC7_UNCW3|nr:MAG: hypothetical protein AMJ87_00335 [candidate division WOR_3 bacterium SM23_60]
MNERLQILKLLEEGKINAEEAERLLEAVGRSSTHEKGTRHKIWSSIEGLPKVISAALGNSFSESAEEEFHKYPSKKKIKFKGISGNLEINGTDTDRIDIQKDGFAKIKELGDSIAVKALSGNVKISVPKETDLAIAGISGDIEISNIVGDLEIESVSGDIIGKNLSGSLSGEIVSGDMDLDYVRVEKVRIKSKSGNITLRFDKKVEAEIEIETTDGDVKCDFDLKDRREEDNVLSGIINKPSAKIEVKNKHGDVEIKQRS